MVNDHKVLEKFQGMFSMKDVERLGGQMTDSLIAEKKHGLQLEWSEESPNGS